MNGRGMDAALAEVQKKLLLKRGWKGERTMTTHGRVWTTCRKLFVNATSIRVQTVASSSFALLAAGLPCTVSHIPTQHIHSLPKLPRNQINTI